MGSIMATQQTSIPYRMNRLRFLVVAQRDLLPRIRTQPHGPFEAVDPRFPQSLAAVRVDFQDRGVILRTAYAHGSGSINML